MQLPNLKQARTAKGLSRLELAVKLTLAERTIINIESGKSTTENNARRIAKVLCVPLQQLKGGDDAENH